MIQIKGSSLSLGYEGKAIVRPFSFEIESGDYISIVGENGSGKSTFIKTILGLVEPIDGRVEYQNGFSKKDIGYLPQESDIMRDFPSSVFEVVLSGSLNRRKFSILYTKEEKERARETLRRLSIDRLEKESFQSLSGGERQRVLLARALMAADKMLLLDEPVTALDMKASFELYRTLHDLNGDGVTILLVTHDIHPALNDSNKIMHFSDSDVVFLDKEAYFSSPVGKEFMHEAFHDD